MAARAAVAEATLARTIAEAQAVLDELRSAKKWEVYNSNLDDQTRHFWRDRGISDWFQDWFKVGYSPETYWGSPSITIPIWGHEWKVSNVKHRLLEPNGHGKYRSETKGLPAMPFICNPDITSGPLFIAEGEIKALRTFIEIDSNNMQVAGIPSKSPNDNILKVFANYEPIWLCLDNDVSANEINKVAAKLGKERVRIVQIPGGKIDDLINANMLDKSGLRRYMRYAVRA